MDNVFAWTFWRFGFATGLYYVFFRMDDGSEWFRVGLGLYLRTKGATNVHPK